MKKHFWILFLINIICLQISAQPFSIVIQDTVVILKKKMDVVKLNLIINKHVEEETITLQSFYKYVKRSCFMSDPYIDKNGTWCSPNQPGMYYFVQYKNDDFLRGNWNSLDAVPECEKGKICIDTLNMTYTINSGCINEKLVSLDQDVTYFTVFPAIKYDYRYKYLRRYVLPKGNEFYLTLFYVFPRKFGENSLVITSNKVKLIIK